MKLTRMAAGLLALAIGCSNAAVVPGIESCITAKAAEDFACEAWGAYYVKYMHPSENASAWELVQFCTESDGSGTLSEEQAAEITAFSVPASVDGLPVTGIGTNAFYDLAAVTEITLPDSVTSIGSGAFSHCASLTGITLPDSVTSIGSGAFASCTSLTEITIPGSVREIGAFPFENCTSLTGIHVDGGSSYVSADGVLLTADQTLLVSYPAGKQDTSYLLPDSVISIDDTAFYACSALTEFRTAGNKHYTAVDGVLLTADRKTLVAYPAGRPDASYTIPDSVTGIGDAAFCANALVQEITIPDSVTSVGMYPFISCTALKEITLPDSVTSMGTYLFCNCTSLTNAVLPKKTTEIGAAFFLGCKSLQSYTIPDGVTDIGEGAFMECTSLQELTIPDSVTTISNLAFSACAFTSITIPDSVTSIGAHAFEDCSEALAICGEPGSAAETYAKENGITFRSTKQLFCDLNADNTVNASDAAIVLIASAAVGAGDTSKAIPAEQADVTGDGTVNASDAAKILIYAAAVGAGYEGTVTEYFAK